MDADALQALEFVAITERLARATQTPRGAELALALVPSADPDEVARRQGLAAEAVTLLDEAVEPPLHGIHDVCEAVELAARGGVLTPDAVAAVASTISGGLRPPAAPAFASTCRRSSSRYERGDRCWRSRSPRGARFVGSCTTLPRPG